MASEFDQTTLDLLVNAGLSIIHASDGLTLTDGSLYLSVDFAELLPRVRQGRLNKELLIKAAKIKNASGFPVVIDATAGLGEESFLLAAAGFEVHMIEQNPVLCMLIEDACERAAQVSGLASIVSHMHLHTGDSVQLLQEIALDQDLELNEGIIYLDPMFPERTKSAAIKKKFQLIHHLEQPCCNEFELLDAAIRVKPKKVIIKRPIKADYLGGIKPSYSLRGKAIRFDVIVPT